MNIRKVVILLSITGLLVVLAWWLFNQRLEPAGRLPIGQDSAKTGLENTSDPELGLEQHNQDGEFDSSQPSVELDATSVSQPTILSPANTINQFTVSEVLELDDLPTVDSTGVVLTVSADGTLALTSDQASDGGSLPDGDNEEFLFYDNDEWKATDALRNVDDTLYAKNKLVIESDQDDHSIELIPTGNAGFLSSNAGALRIDNTGNIGAGISIFSNAGSEAEGNMINVKVDNPNYNQAAFYMNYDGLSNAVEIIANTDDRSSNALSITNYNELDSALGVIGYEKDRGTVKISHNGSGATPNASGLSIDLKGTGTRAQGIYVDSTATGGTLGNLLRLRNEGIDRFVVGPDGAVVVGSSGVDSSITKVGTNPDDEFFVGTNGAFRVQRAASNSEAFRTQIVGDSQGRWLGTADGRLKWGDGASAQDVTLVRGGPGLLNLEGALRINNLNQDYDTVVKGVGESNLLYLDASADAIGIGTSSPTGRVEIRSSGSNTNLLTLTSSDGSRLGRFLETGGGDGWFQVDDDTGSPRFVFRADGGNSYLNSGNIGLGTTAFGTGASKVISIGNGTAPSTSIANGVQLFAVDADDGDSTVTSELRVRDEDGNVTTISPHNFSLLPNGPSESLAWAYYSEKDGQAINVDMLRAVRLVESLSGVRLVQKVDLATGQAVLGEYELPETPDLTLVPGQEYDETTDTTSFLSQVRFRLQAVFQDLVTFNARVLFNDQIQFGSSMAGSAQIPAGAKRVWIQFDQPFNPDHLPSVFLSPQAKESISVQVSQVSADGFEVLLQTAQPNSVRVEWFAVLVETDEAVTVLEEFSSSQPAELPAETGQDQPAEPEAPSPENSSELVSQDPDITGTTQTASDSTELSSETATEAATSSLEDT